MSSIWYGRGRNSNAHNLLLVLQDIIPPMGMALAGAKRLHCLPREMGHLSWTITCSAWSDSFDILSRTSPTLLKTRPHRRSRALSTLLHVQLLPVATQAKSPRAQIECIHHSVIHIYGSRSRPTNLVERILPKPTPRTQQSHHPPPRTATVRRLPAAVSCPATLLVASVPQAPAVSREGSLVSEARRANEA